ncbi:mitochondrial import receptor subunit TOM70-like [Argiope bruennichi]|uniref:mitochondrial import receptor subunit TOM70-like n=1 Tax=Argiope bruennichi TaxID=94029 RepID=UPI002494069A|nr:mitochondrial import receptor subunit TOM70-like [Argiope bruennichi]
MAATSKSNAPQLSKWQLAVILGIGTTATLGLAYLYYRKKQTKTSDKKCEDVYENSETKPKKRELINDVTYTKKETSAAPETPYSKAKAFKDKGNKLFKEGQFDKAIECYTSAIEICPIDRGEDLATFYQNRAAAYENLKNFEAVINDTTKAVEYNKSYLKALYRRAKAYEELGDWQKCLEDITAVCMFDGFRTEGYLKMTDKVMKELSKKEAKETFSQREPKLPSKHFVRHYFISFSEDPIMKSVDEYKKDMKSPSELSGFRLVIHHLAEENFDEIIPNCNVEIDRRGPDLPEAYLVRATFKLLQGQIQDSLADLTTLYALESVDVKVRVNCLIKIGTLKVQLEKMDEALQHFNKAIELDLNNADIYLHRGQVYLLMERFNDCLKDMEKSCSLNPNFPSACAQKCYVQYRCGIQFNDENQKSAALKGFEEIEKNFPNCSESLFLYAQVLSECGEYQKAETYFKRAGELDPKDPNVYVHLGILALQWKEDVNQTIEYLNKAISMDEKCQFAYETLGSIEIQKGNLQRGLELFQKAIDTAHTETELAHLYSLLLAAKAQAKAAERFGLDLGNLV